MEYVSMTQDFPQTIVESEWGESFYIKEEDWATYVADIYAVYSVYEEDESLEEFEERMLYIEWSLIVSHEKVAVYKRTRYPRETRFNPMYGKFAPNEWGEYSIVELGDFDELIVDFPVDVVAAALRQRIKGDPDGAVKTLLLSLSDEDTVSMWRWFFDAKWWDDQPYWVGRLHQELLLIEGFPIEGLSAYWFGRLQQELGG